MLKSINTILAPELLWLLAPMGHGDCLVVVDANHPATSIVAATLLGAPDPAAGHESWRGSSAPS
ncbi:RbsD/FucU domain-containing protein [Bradyrhizobium sp. DN5]|uniref:RbsD/FucU domain-containing protein n=1 Tax=Bradyrhizobium sp. DN5 TaxID=3056950 RepID=UPI003523F01B